MNTGCRGWDRTSASAGQSRMPYRLATRHYIRGLASPLHVPALYYILLYLRLFSDDSTSLGSFFSDEAREMGLEPTFARATIWCFTN